MTRLNKYLLSEEIMDNPDKYEITPENMQEVFDILVWRVGFEQLINKIDADELVTLRKERYGESYDD